MSFVAQALGVLRPLGIYYWKDLFEISIISFFVYRFLKWLAADKRTNLVLPFIGYASLLFFAYFGNFQTLSFIFFITLPFALICFVVIHQHTLQRHYVLVKNQSSVADRVVWFDEFTRACLTALNSNREFICVIERLDSLKSLIHCSSIFDCELKRDLFEIVLEKQHSTDDFFVWITKEGKIVAINGLWKLTSEAEWLSAEVRSLAKWKQDALFITSKTDAIVFKVNPLTRTFDLIVHGTVSSDLFAQQAFETIKQHLTSSPTAPGVHSRGHQAPSRQAHV